MPAKTVLTTSRHKTRTGLALCLVAAMGLGACAAPASSVTADRPEPATQPAVPVETAKASMPEVPQAFGREKPVAPEGICGPPEAVSAVMAHADRLRGLSSSELLQELNALGDLGTMPVRQMQAALVLIQLHQTAASARALGLLQRVAANPAPEGAALKPLAQLLAQQVTVSMNDQRRLEDTVDRQAQQLRDSQRRIEMLSDRLDAMRDIERSLTPRTPNRVPAP